MKVELLIELLQEQADAFPNQDVVINNPETGEDSQIEGVEMYDNQIAIIV